MLQARHRPCRSFLERGHTCPDETLLPARVPAKNVIGFCLVKGRLAAISERHPTVASAMKPSVLLSLLSGDFRGGKMGSLESGPPRPATDW